MQNGSLPREVSLPLGEGIPLPRQQLEADTLPLARRPRASRTQACMRQQFRPTPASQQVHFKGCDSVFISL